MTDESLLCRFGRRCRAAVREIIGNTTKRTPALAAGRGLCLTCERFGRVAVAGLGGLYDQLHAELGKDTGRDVRPGAGGGTSAKVDPPTPLRLQVDVWCREIGWALEVWAEPVWERVAAAAAARGVDVGAAPASPWGRSRMLGRQYSVLLALPAQTYVPYVGDGALADPAEDDGPGAVVQLVGLYERARRWAGEGERVEARHMPCPPPAAGGCGGQNTLVQTIGSDRVRCSACEWTCSDLEYGRYAITLRPPATPVSAGGWR